MTDAYLTEITEWYSGGYRGTYTPSSELVEIIPRAYDIVNNSIFMSGYEAMPVKVTFDTAAAAARITGAVGAALKAAKPQIIADCNEFCPKDDGTLRRSAETNSSVFDNGDVKPSMTASIS